jgi:hypothetical protein
VSTGRSGVIFSASRHDHAPQGERVDVELELASHDPREIQQIVDELCLGPGVSLDGLDGTRGLLLTHVSGDQQVGPT